MPQYDSHALSTAVVFAIRKIIKEINSKLEKSPDKFLEKQYCAKREKLALRIDLLAEDRFEDTLAEELLRSDLTIEVFGEETIRKDTTFHGRDSLFALADIIDGTDLLEL